MTEGMLDDTDDIKLLTQSRQRVDAGHCLRSFVSFAASQVTQAAGKDEDA